MMILIRNRHRRGIVATSPRGLLLPLVASPFQLLLLLTAVAAVVQVPSGYYLHPSASIVDITPTERGIRVSKSGNSSPDDDDDDDDGNKIPPREILLRVPMGYIITPARGRETPAGAAIWRRQRQRGRHDSITKVGEDTYLALWICHAAYNRDSLEEHSRAYIDSLPRRESLGHLPIFWPESDLAFLKGSRTPADISEKRKLWESLYDAICSLDASFRKETSMDAFFWAKALVESRAFVLRDNYGDDAPVIAGGSNVGLVMLGDMINHCARSDPRTCDWKMEVAVTNNDDGGGIEHGEAAFVVRTGPNGLTFGTSEVCLSYGLHSNGHYLGAYGFCVERNVRHDGASPDEAHLSFPSSSLGLVAVSIGDDDAAKRLLHDLRVSVATDDEMNSMKELGKSSSVLNVPFCSRNEKAAITCLRDAVEETLARYDTSLKEDIELLRRKKQKNGADKSCLSSSYYIPMGTNRRSAILLQSGEKRVLQHWLLLCKASLLCLDDVESGEMTWEIYCELLETTLTRVTSIADP